MASDNFNNSSLVFAFTSQFVSSSPISYETKNIYGKRAKSYTDTLINYVYEKYSAFIINQDSEKHTRCYLFYQKKYPN